MPRFVVAAAVFALVAGPASLDARPPPETPPPAGHGKPPPAEPSPKPGPKEPRKAQRAWARPADAACGTALDARRELLAGVRARPSPTARRTFLRILVGTLRIERTLAARLEAVEAPPEARAAFQQALTLLRTRIDEGAALVVALERRGDSSKLERQLQRDRALYGGLVRLWARLGSAGCATYFRSARGR